MSVGYLADTRQAREILDAIQAAGLSSPRFVFFGTGFLDRLPDLAVHAVIPHGLALLLMGAPSPRQAELARRIARLLAPRPVAVLPGVDREPDVDLIDRLTAEARRAMPALILGVGGGSVLDAAKAVAALAPNAGSVEDYLEGVGRGWTLKQPPLPHIAIPTVSGTGAEMTRNAVIAVPHRACKRSMRFPEMMPAAALADPALTLTVPAAVTAASGLDALTQLIESCISLKRRPATTAVAHLALPLLRGNLERCAQVPDDATARAAVALAALASGFCLANSGLAMAHGIAAALGARCHVPHGLACGILLPHTLRHNAPRCRAELTAALAAFLGANAGGDPLARGLEEIEALQRRLGIPADLRHLHLQPAEVSQLAADSMGSSMSGNPLPMTPPTVEEFLRPLCGKNQSTE